MLAFGSTASAGGGAERADEAMSSGELTKGVSVYGIK